MAAPTAAEILVDTLIAWHVDTIFGIPGDGINGIIEALRTRKDKIRFIQVRHEEAAAFGVRLRQVDRPARRLHRHLRSRRHPSAERLYDAKLDHQPVLAITGLQFHDLLHTFTQQDVELDKLFIDVAVYNARIMGPNHVETPSSWPAAPR